VVTLGNAITIDDLLIHDERRRSTPGYLLRPHGLPGPGVCRDLPCVERPTSTTCSSADEDVIKAKGRVSWTTCSLPTTWEVK